MVFRYFHKCPSDHLMSLKLVRRILLARIVTSIFSLIDSVSYSLIFVPVCLLDLHKTVNDLFSHIVHEYCFNLLVTSFHCLNNYIIHTVKLHQNGELEPLPSDAGARKTQSQAKFNILEGIPGSHSDDFCDKASRFVCIYSIFQGKWYLDMVLLLLQ